MQTCCLCALLHRLVVYLHYCADFSFILCCWIDLLFLYCCANLLFICTVVHICCLFLQLFRLVVYLYCWTNVFCMLFSPFQHLLLFLIRTCTVLFINCKICFVLPWSTNEPNINRSRRGRDGMVVWFATTSAISDYQWVRMPLMARCTRYYIMW